MTDLYHSNLWKFHSLVFWCFRSFNGYFHHFTFSQLFSPGSRAKSVSRFSVLNGIASMLPFFYFVKMKKHDDLFFFAFAFFGSFWAFQRSMSWCTCTKAGFHCPEFGGDGIRRMEGLTISSFLTFSRRQVVYPMFCSCLEQLNTLGLLPAHASDWVSSLPPPLVVFSIQT